MRWFSDRELSIPNPAAVERQPIASIRPAHDDLQDLQLPHMQACTHTPPGAQSSVPSWGGRSTQAGEWVWLGWEA